MATPCKPVSGTHRDLSEVDREAVEAELSRGKIEVSTTASNYSGEEYTFSYIGTIFKAINKLGEYWLECVKKSRNYITNFEDIEDPLPFIDDTAYLDVNEYDTSVGGIVATKDTGLNVRSDPSTKSSIQTVFDKGSKVEIIGDVVDKDGTKWYQVKLSNGKIGYVSGKYINTTGEIKTSNSTVGSVQSPTNSPSTSTPNTTQVEPQEKTIYERGEATVVLKDINSHLNVRSSASTKDGSNIVGALNYGDKVEVLGPSDDPNWVRIKYKGEERLVSKDYLK